jgi:hypothetical protein
VPELRVSSHYKGRFSMRHTTLLSAFACSLLWFQCSSTSDTILARQRISLIKSWQLDYSSSVDPSAAASGQESLSSLPGQVERNLRFAELTSEILRARFKIPVSVDTSAACGHIRLTAVEIPKGPPKSIEIAIYDETDRVLARTRIWNDAEAMIGTWSDAQKDRYRFNERLAAYVAEKVAGLMLGEQEKTQH